jgi:O-antigen/teichoic acid export membrane protein
VSRHRTLRDLLLGFSSQLAYKALGFVVLAVLARHLTSDDFGRVMFALTLCGVAVLFTDIGSEHRPGSSGRRRSRHRGS